jgi:hypothetical protein
LRYQVLGESVAPFSCGGTLPSFVQYQKKFGCTLLAQTHCDLLRTIASEKGASRMDMNFYTSLAKL